MRKIIDSNMLGHPELRAYLAKSPKNFAVLTDYAAMEAYKGKTLASIFPSMEILAEFSRQVIILKTTGVVCGLRGRNAGLQRRMIDEPQTRDFAGYCKALQVGKAGNPAVLRQLLEHGREADAHMQRMLSDAANMPEAVKGMTATFTPSELRIIRTGSQLSSPLIRKVLESILSLAQALFLQHPRPAMIGRREELLNTFLFRSALCAFLWVLDWISVGRTGNANIGNIRNDLVDVNFATYATYFDGLMSNDSKPVAVYRRASFILEAITDPSPSAPKP